MKKIKSTIAKFCHKLLFPTNADFCPVKICPYFCDKA